MSRACVPCSACCEALEVRAVASPAWTRCEHQREDGCGIYEARPEGCRPYRCLWLDGELADDERPDLVGVIVDDGLTPAFKPLWGNDAVCVREIKTASATEPRAAALIKRLNDAGRAVFIKRPDGTTEPVGEALNEKARRIEQTLNRTSS